MRKLFKTKKKRITLYKIFKLFSSWSVPEDYKKNPGAVEAIAEQPGHPDNILIGYNRGLMVLWNKATPGAQQVSLVFVVTLCIHNYTLANAIVTRCNAYMLFAKQQCGSMYNPASSFISDTHSIEFKWVLIHFLIWSHQLKFFFCLIL